MSALFTRRKTLGLIAAGLGAAVAGGPPPAFAGAVLAFGRHASVGDDAIFGLPRQEAWEVYQMATKSHSLAPSYQPRDLVSAAAVSLPANGQQLIRAHIVEDTQALIRAAAAEGHRLWINSGYRSYAYQQALFNAQVARRDGDEDMANRFSARPGQSNHQLGTTIDFNGFRAFGESPAGLWLWEHAHLFGFVFPYTQAAQERTGYVAEPWHARWVGYEMAHWMEQLGYQTLVEPTVDDLIGAVREAARLDQV